MPEHSLNDLYSDSSIQYMKRQNFWNLLIWIIALGGGFALINYFVVSQFTGISAEQGIEDFSQLLLLDMMGIIVLSILWWFIINTDGMVVAPCRSYFEQNSIVCGFIFSVLAVLIPLVLSFKGDFSIKTTNGHVNSLCCPFILPSIFIFLIYFAPPVQIREMIAPGKWWGRYVVAALAALTVVIFFTIDFL